MVYNSVNKKKDDKKKSVQNANANTNSQKSTTNTTKTNPNVTSKNSLNGVSQDTYNAMTQQFAPSDNYNNALAQIQSQLTQLNSGKTSYSDQIAQLMKDYQNREKFQYNPDTDALFQNALAGAMNAGQSAMQNTMGQASMLTGGYGSSYATSAANQAYNGFIEGAYDNLPEYYNMALNAYNMEAENMLNQLNMLNTADQTEWGRMYDAYGANADFANNMYNREYQQYADSVSNAFNLAGMQNADYWNQQNMDFNKEQFAWEQDTWQQEFDWNKDTWQKEFDNANSQWQQEFDWNKNTWQQEFDTANSQWAQEFAETQKQNAWEQNAWQQEFDWSKNTWEKEFALAQAAKSSSGGGGGSSSGSSGSGSSGYSYANGENIKASKMTEIINGARAAQSAGGDSSVYAYLKAQGLSNSTYQYVLSVLEDTHEDTVKKSAKTTLANGFLSAALRGYTK